MEKPADPKTLFVSWHPIIAAEPVPGAAAHVYMLWRDDLGDLDWFAIVPDTGGYIERSDPRFEPLWGKCGPPIKIENPDHVIGRVRRALPEPRLPIELLPEHG